MKRAAVFGAALVTLAIGMFALAKAVNQRARNTTPVTTQAIATEPDESFQPSPEWLTEYTLTERSGRKFASAELDGTVHVVNFFFASCPVQCPLQTAKVKQLDRQYGEQGVRFVSITCDPKADTVEALRQFANKYDADPERWLFLTGDLTYLRRVGAEVYSVAVTERGHRNELIAVDKWGKPRGYFDWNNAAKLGELRALLDELLAETEPPSEPTKETPAIQDADDDGLPDEVGNATSPPRSFLATLPKGGWDLRFLASSE